MSESEGKNLLESHASVLWAVAIVIVGVTAVLGYVIVNANLTGSQQFVAITMIVGLVISVTLGSVSAVMKTGEDSKKK